MPFGYIGGPLDLYSQVMDASGLVTLRHNNLFLHFFPVYGISDDIDTYYDELHIYNDRVISLKIFQNRELSIGIKHNVLAVSNIAGELLWKHNTNIVLTNNDERLYLSPMFQCLFLSDAKKSVVYDLDVGVVRNTIHYSRYQRISKDVDSGDSEISAYAQTGFSIWDLR